MAPALLLIIGLFWLLPLALQLRTQRSGVSRRVQMGVRVALLVALIVLNTLPIALAISNMADPDSLGALVLISARAFPGGAVALWILCSLLLGSAYLLSLKQFERVEVSKKSVYVKWPILEAIRGEN